MKHLILGLTACTLSFSAMAQQAPLPCGTDLERQRLIETYPEFLQIEAEAEAEMRQLLQNSASERDENTLYTIPIVFHIVHLNGEENISNEQILDALEVLNRDFQLMNPDSANVHPAFADRIGNPRMQFTLPTIDPYGNCTNGIERIKSPQTFLGESSSKFTPWPRNKYLNVWVTKGIASGAAGYFSAAPSFADGVLIRHDYVGRIGTGAEFSSRALTHEVGHFFDLNHCWGENNGVPGANTGFHMQLDCGDDGVQDTPITRGWNTCRPESEWADCDRQPMRNTIFNFDDVTTTSGTVDPSVVIPALDSIDFHVRANFSSFSATGVSANSEVTGKFGYSNWSTGANDGETDFAVLNMNPINSSKYYEFTVTPVVTDYISVTSIDFTVDRNTTGVRTFAVRSATNNFGTNLPLNVNGDPNISVPSGNIGFFTTDATGESGTITVNVPGHMNSATPFTFRFYAWNAEDAAGTFVIDQVVVRGEVGAVENVENYMEYSYCPSAHMFTDGQVARLRAYAETTTNQRNSLWSDATLQSTGVADGYQWNCAPKADFYAVVGNSLSSPTIPFSPTACSGDVVRFMDNSTGAFPESWVWTFEDGTPSTSTEQNPDVVFGSIGWKTVSLGVSNANGGTTKVDEYAILVGGNEITPNSDYSEDFENVAEDLNPYIAMNYAGNFTQFTKYTEGGHNSNSCAFLNSGDRYPINFIDPTNLGDYDELLTPSFDLQYFQSAQLSFWYSYSTTTTNIDTVSERLEVWSSTDCGANWQVRSNINEEELITNGNLLNGPGTWEQKTINLPPSALNQDIRFRFRYISSEFSGDLYIDDINISGPVGIEALDAARLLNVFPNPSNDRFTVQAFGMDNYDTQVTVTDMRGAVIYNKTLAPTGDNGIEISSLELGMANGLYFLRVSNELGTSTQKLTVGK
ncbi:MAG: T9SS type A sorting domain-containing protein [Flavobacteriales bacterium]|nr:T9SS type A sorting domain-containing protein [Flavobacteriales bacterium]